MINDLELAVEQCHAARNSGRSSHTLFLPILTPERALTLLTTLRREGFTPDQTFKSGRVDPRTGVGKDITLNVTL